MSELLVGWFAHELDEKGNIRRQLRVRGGAGADLYAVDVFSQHDGSYSHTELVPTLAMVGWRFYERAELWREHFDEWGERYFNEEL
jgi:hypothetical protein